MTEQPQITDPISDLVQASVAMHVLFESHLAAGFTEDQALRLIALMSAAVARRTGESES